MTDHVDISVVIPIYHNASSIIELNDRLVRVLSQYTYQIIYVDDHSLDNSSNLLKDLASKNQQIMHIQLSQNIGQQKATREGFKLVTGHKIVVLDGDLQDSPELIPELYKSIGTGKNAIFVKRRGIYQSIGRMITSVLIKYVVQLISGLHYKAGSYYMFDRAILNDVNSTAIRCRHPYLSIIVANFSESLNYIRADRGKSTGASSYDFTKRLQAALMAIYCSFYCTYVKINRH